MFTTLVVLAILFFLATIALAYVHFVRNPLPFPDKGSRIFTCPSPQAMETLVRLMHQHGVRPAGRIDTAGVQRAIFDDWTTIVNTAPPEFLRRMNNPTGAIALVAKDPGRAARDAAAFLKARGYSAEVLGELDPQAPKGSLVFVRTDVLLAGLLVFRWPLLKMKPRPSKWRYTTR